ncbi:MAG: YceI family protein [Pseudomonadota bacterium]
MKRIIGAGLIFALVACGGETDTQPQGQTEVTETSAAVLDMAPAMGEHSWTVDKEASRITFTGIAYNDEVLGTFTDFDVAIELDPDNPAETGRIEAVISIASVDAGNSDRNDTLPSKNWFWVKEYPVATFRSEEVRGLGEGAYEAAGTLTIRDVSEPLTLPFTLDVTEGRAIADGEVTLNRQTFGVGQGAYAKPEDIPVEVGVNIHIEATK